jgi:hypothetical protein
MDPQHPNVAIGGLHPQHPDQGWEELKCRPEAVAPSDDQMRFINHHVVQATVRGSILQNLPETADCILRRRE